VGKLMSRDRTTISHACMIVEDMRDDPVLDQRICRIEALLTTVREQFTQNNGILTAGEEANV